MKTWQEKTPKLSVGRRSRCWCEDMIVGIFTLQSLVTKGISSITSCRAEGLPVKSTKSALVFAASSPNRAEPLVVCKGRTSTSKAAGSFCTTASALSYAPVFPSGIVPERQLRPSLHSAVKQAAALCPAAEASLWLPFAVLHLRGCHIPARGIALCRCCCKTVDRERALGCPAEYLH